MLSETNPRGARKTFAAQSLFRQNLRTDQFQKDHSDPDSTGRSSGTFLLFQNHFRSFLDTRTIELFWSLRCLITQEREAGNLHSSLFCSSATSRSCSAAGVMSSSNLIYCSFTQRTFTMYSIEFEDKRLRCWALPHMFLPVYSALLTEQGDMPKMIPTN